MSGGVYGGGERASGFGLPSVKPPHLQLCAPNPRDPSSGHPGASHLCVRAGPAPGLGPAPFLLSVLPGRSLLPGPTSPPFNPPPPGPRPLPSQKREWLEQGHWARRGSRGLTPTLRIPDSRPSSHLPRRVLKAARLWLCPDLPSELYRAESLKEIPSHSCLPAQMRWVRWSLTLAPSQSALGTLERTAPR